MKQWRAFKARSKPLDLGNMKGKKRKRDGIQIEGTNEEVLEFEVKALLDGHARCQLGSSRAKVEENTQSTNSTTNVPLPERFSEIELDVLEMSSIGDGLALSPEGDHVYTVPFTVPGDKVLAKVVTQFKGRPYGTTDFVKLIKPGPKRDDAGIECKYFATCSGCQLQMLPYEEQLKHKKTIVEKAYRNFSGLDPEEVPPIEDTFGSPRQYGYRTKLTPHFDGPGLNAGKKSKGYTEVPPIGFAEKGRRRVMDIESCPIATDIVQKGLTRERAKVAKNISSYTNGATVLLRETTERVPKTSSPGYDAVAPTEGTLSVATPTAKVLDDGRPAIITEFPKYTETKTYTSDMNGISSEYIDDWKFTNMAGFFFQNNNSILSPFTAYIRDRCITPAPSQGSDGSTPSPPIKYLLDAYCGSGLFAITLSSLFKSTLGIDVAQISFARANAAANNVTNCGFIEADASDLFIDVPFPSDQTLLVIDPPRKGASEDFLRQLLRFGPKRVVYVSCNVHTQARDVGMLVRGDDHWKYSIETIRGFDFFPQTGHVEGVAFLNRKPALPAAHV